MNVNAQTLVNEHQAFQTKIKKLIAHLYRQNVKDHTGKVLPEVALTEIWEFEGQEFNTLTKQGLAYRINNTTNDLFSWDDLDTESLIEVVQILESKDFD